MSNVNIETENLNKSNRAEKIRRDRHHKESSFSDGGKRIKMNRPKERGSRFWEMDDND